MCICKINPQKWNCSIRKCERHFQIAHQRHHQQHAVCVFVCQVTPRSSGEPLPQNHCIFYQSLKTASTRTPFMLKMQNSSELESQRMGPRNIISYFVLVNPTYFPDLGNTIKQMWSKQQMIVKTAIFFSLLLLEQCRNLVLKSNLKLSAERKKNKSLLMMMMKTMKLQKGRLVAERLKMLGRLCPSVFLVVRGR